MKKKFLSLLLIAVILISCFMSLVCGAKSSKVAVSVQLQSVQRVQNNHVGNEWSFGATVNEKELFEGNSIEISTTSAGKITIVSMAEEDDKYPDLGEKTLIVPVNKLKANKATTYTSNVTVIEDKGRYAGNEAVWKFTYVIKKK